MKTLLIVRHAKSSWDHPDLSDHDRPLNQRGKMDAPLMGELLKDEDVVPDLMISSTAKRAKKTAELIAEAAGFDGKLLTTRTFYHADPDLYIEVLRSLPEDVNRVMIVGHNPGMEELIYDLTGESVRFTTANVAQIDLKIDDWAKIDEDVEGILVNLWRPRGY